MHRLMICFGFLVLVAGCDGQTRLRGKIVGPDDKPIAGVNVRVSESNDPHGGSESTTDESGQYSVGLIHAPSNIDLVFTANKDGYKPYRKEFKVRQREEFPKKIVLEPKRKGPAPRKK